MHEGLDLFGAADLDDIDWEPLSAQELSHAEARAKADQPSEAVEAGVRFCAGGDVTEALGLSNDATFASGLEAFTVDVDKGEEKSGRVIDVWKATS